MDNLSNEELMKIFIEKVLWQDDFEKERQEILRRMNNNKLESGNNIIYAAALARANCFFDSENNPIKQ